MSCLTRNSIDPTHLIRQVQSRDRGGIAVFVGTVRDHHEGRRVLRLEYSAYESMAEAECERILADAEVRWPVTVAMAHRLGHLEIGELAVVVAAGAAHRSEAFAACRHVIEEVKRRVPVWKKEFYADGTVAWVDPSNAAEPRTAGVE